MTTSRVYCGNQRSTSFSICALLCCALLGGAGNAGTLPPKPLANPVTPRDKPAVQTHGHFEEMVATQSWHRLGEVTAPLLGFPGDPAKLLYVSGEIWAICFGAQGTVIVAEDAAELKAGHAGGHAGGREKLLAAAPPVAALHDGESLWVLYADKLERYDAKLGVSWAGLVVGGTALAFDGESLYVALPDAILAFRGGALEPVVSGYLTWAGFGSLLARDSLLYAGDGNVVHLFNASGARLATLAVPGEVVGIAFAEYGRLAVLSAGSAPALTLCDLRLGHPLSRRVRAGRELLVTRGDLWVFDAETGQAEKVPALAPLAGVEELLRVAPPGPVRPCYDGMDVWVASLSDRALRCVLQAT